MPTINTSLYPGLQPNPQDISLAAAVTAASNNSNLIITWKFHKKPNVGDVTFDLFGPEKEIYSLDAERIVLDENLNLQGKVCLLPPHCVLQICNGGRFYNGTLISQETIIVGDDGVSLPSMPSPCAIKGYSKIEPVPYYPMPNRDEPASVATTPDLDIVGKIYNSAGNEVTIRGGVIDRGTPLRYTYTGLQSVEGRQYDDAGPDSEHPYPPNQAPFGISNLGRRARNLGLTDCIFGLNVRRILTGDELNSENGEFARRGYSSASGPYPLVCGSQGYLGEEFCYTPYDLACEMLANGLSVKALKFYSKSYVGTLDNYCDCVYNFTRDLLAQMRLLGLSLPTEFDISNEMAVWTNQTAADSTRLTQLADSIKNNLASAVKAVLDVLQPNVSHLDVLSLRFEPAASFAGTAQRSRANTQLYGHLLPLLNIYPTLSFAEGAALADTPALRTELARIMCEHFPPNGIIWGDSTNEPYREAELPICEIGVKPYEKALRYPENYNMSALGTFNNHVLPAFWRAVEQAALRCNFPYINVFYVEEFYDESSTDESGKLVRTTTGNEHEWQNANIEVPMHDFFLTFANPNECETLELPEKITIYRPENTAGIVKFCRILRPTNLYLDVYVHGTTGTRHWTVRNGYSIHFEGEVPTLSSDYDSIDPADWFLVPDVEPFELDIFLFVENEDGKDRLYLCADSRYVSRIDLVTMNSGDPVAREVYNSGPYGHFIRPMRD